MPKSARMLVLAIAAALMFSAPALADTDGAHWIGVWGFPPVGGPNYAPSATPAPDSTLADVTVRQVVEASAGGRQIRIRLSNEFGAAPIRVGAAHIALATAGGGIVAETDRALTFGGEPSVIIPASAPMYSDPVDLDVAALDDIAVSIYYPEPTLRPGHRTQQYVSAPGDHAGEAQMAEAHVVRTGALLSGLEVVPTVAREVIVAFGDSITEGAYTDTSHAAWPKRLAERLGASPEGRRFAVVNAGISGNRLLHDATGANALARFDRDVLGVPGVTRVIVLLGINDIGRRVQQGNDSEAVTTAQLIAAHRQLIARAHAHGLIIYGATLTPYAGAFYYDVPGDAQRQELNQWIRTSGAYDGVIDFDAIARDPAHPSQFLPDYDRGDHLHPSPQGYEAMGDAIDLSLFGRPHPAH